MQPQAAQTKTGPKGDRPFPLVLLGWGLLTAWGLVSLVLDVPPMPGGPAMVNALTSASALAGLALAACILRFCPWLLAGAVRRLRVSAWTLGVCMAVGSAANQVLQLPGISWASAAVALQVFSSFAYVGLMILWFTAYVRQDPQVVESASIWSTVLCAGTVALVHMLPNAASMVAWAFLPLVSVACLVRVRVGEVSASGAPFEYAPSPSASIKGSIKVFVGIAVCGLVLALPQNLSPLVATATEGALLLGTLGGLLLAAVLVLGYTASTHRIGMQSLFTWLQPVAAVGLLCAAAAFSPVAVAGTVLAGAGQWALYVFVWIYAAERPHADLADALGVYIGARMAFDVGGGAAALFGWGLMGLVGPQAAHGLFVYVLFGAVVLLVVVGSLGVPLGPGAKEVMGEKPLEPKPGQTLDDLVNARAGAVGERYGLSEREGQILVRLLRGYSTAAIRNELGVAKGTVDTYISRIYRKCSVHGRQELVELAERQGVASPGAAPTE